MTQSRALTGRVVIPAEALLQLSERTRALDRRMVGLSPKHKAKAWKRIVAEHWRRSLSEELSRLAQDITQRVVGVPWVRELGIGESCEGKIVGVIERQGRRRYYVASSTEAWERFARQELPFY